MQNCVKNQDFDFVYSAKTEKEKYYRKTKFIELIMYYKFYEKVRQVHSIILILGRLLGVFDRDGSLISEVLVETDKARQQIRELEETDFINSERKKEIDIVFGDRVENEIIEGLSSRLRVRILYYIHYTSCLLDPVRQPSTFDQ